MITEETLSESEIQIKTIEQKTSKTGRIYFSVDTDKGKFNCFDAEVIGIFRNNLNKSFIVQIAKNNQGFVSTIRAIIKIPDVVQNSTTTSAPIAAIDNKSQAMYTSYAKDIFIAMMEQGDDDGAVMERAINLVKAAKEAFK